MTAAVGYANKVFYVTPEFSESLSTVISEISSSPEEASFYVQLNKNWKCRIGWDKETVSLSSYLGESSIYFYYNKNGCMLRTGKNLFVSSIKEKDSIYED